VCSEQVNIATHHQQAPSNWEGGQSWGNLTSQSVEPVWRRAGPETSAGSAYPGRARQELMLAPKPFQAATILGLIKSSDR
jgi:hypothetical protein